MSVKILLIMTTKELQSNINIVKARITQFRNSELYSDEEKERLIDKENKVLEKLEQELAKNIDVISPELL